jgi:hypothetical protein
VQPEVAAPERVPVAAAGVAQAPELVVAEVPAAVAPARAPAVVVPVARVPVVAARQPPGAQEPEPVEAPAQEPVVAQEPVEALAVVAVADCSHRWARSQHRYGEQWLRLPASQRP